MISLERLLASKPQYRGSFIYGEWKIPQRESARLEVVSPANLDWVFPTVPYSFDHVSEAVECSTRVFRSWAETGLHQRVEALERWSVEIKKRDRLLATTLALETGRSLGDCKQEVARLGEQIRVFIKQGLPLVRSQSLSTEKETSLKVEGHWQARGTLAVLSPFSAPLHWAHKQTIAALLMGNTVIFKASERAPYSSQIYFEAAEAAGFPRGVLQLLQGGADVGSRLVRQTSLHGVLATCSFDVGVKIQKELSENPERLVVLATGGRNAAVVWEGADLARTAESLTHSAYRATGQRCLALSRVFVHPKLLQPLVDLVHELAKGLVISHPFDEEPMPDMGPLISLAAKEKFLRYGGMAESEKAEAVMRAKGLQGVTLQNRKPLPIGHYVSPSIHLVKKWDAKSSYQTHEIFGPDIFFCAVSSLEEAALATNSAGTGLATSFYGKSRDDLKFISENVETGQVFYNRAPMDEFFELPWSTMRRSGNNRMGGISLLQTVSQFQIRIG